MYEHHFVLLNYYIPDDDINVDDEQSRTGIDSIVHIDDELEDADWTSNQHRGTVSTFMHCQSDGDGTNSILYEDQDAV